jgi:hypothetical protein
MSMDTQNLNENNNDNNNDNVFIIAIMIYFV